jgi:hypothetical protein
MSLNSLTEMNFGGERRSYDSLTLQRESFNLTRICRTYTEIRKIFRGKVTLEYYSKFHYCNSVCQAAIKKKAIPVTGLGGL